MAFLGYPRGHRIDPETRCSTAAHGTPNECMGVMEGAVSENRLKTISITQWSPEWRGVAQFFVRIWSLGLAKPLTSSTMRAIQNCKGVSCVHESQKRLA